MSHDVNLFRYVENTPLLGFDPSGYVALIEYRWLMSAAVTGLLGVVGYHSYCMEWAKGEADNSGCVADSANRYNALKHCLGSCCISKVFGEWYTNALGRAYEDFCEWVRGTRDDADHDIANNAFGAAIKRLSCKLACYSLLPALSMDPEVPRSGSDAPPDLWRA